jgi:hypothetical protein
MIKKKKHITDTFTHNDHDYDLSKLDKIIKHNRIRKFDIKDLLWIFKYDDPRKDHPERIKTANIKVPIIVTRWNNKLVVLDGLHRLAKAYIKGIKTLPGRMVFRHELARAKINESNQINEASWENVNGLKTEIFQKNTGGILFYIRLICRNDTYNDIQLKLINKLFNNHKKIIIKSLIIQFKRFNYIETEATIKYMLQFGIEWPELNIIKKSLEIEMKITDLNEAETNNSLKIVAVARHLLLNGHLIKALDYILGTGLTVKKSKELQKLLDEHKNMLIKYNLGLFKDTNYNRSLFFVNKLFRLGLKWPEIIAIEKSSTFELDRNRLSESKRKNVRK